MSTVRIQTGATEPIQLFVVESNGTPLTGLSDLYVRLRRGDGKYLDWADMTFKASSWATKDKPLAEADATGAPGLYEVVGGLDTALVTNAVANDDYVVVPLQTPGTDARLPSPGVIQVGKWADRLDANVSTRATQTSVDALSPLSAAQVTAAVWDVARTAHVASGTFGESVKLNASGLQTDAVNEIVDTVWDEPNATHLDPGSMGEKMGRLDAAVGTRAVPGDAMDLVNNAVDSGALDVTAVSELAGGVWDEALAGHLGAGTAGQAQSRVDVVVSTRAIAGDAMTLASGAVDAAALATAAVAKLAGGVWDLALSGHTGVGTAGEAQALIDAAVSTRAVPGSQMALTISTLGSVANSVWDEALSGHLASGTTGKGLQDASAVSDPSVVAAAVWDRTAASHVAVGTMGQLENRLDANVSTRAQTGDPMDLIANAVTATAVASSGATKIRDTILSDATPRLSVLELRRVPRWLCRRTQ
jgi:hypothetical protein